MRALRTSTILAATLFLAATAGAHPGAAIAVAPDGRVYFVDTGAGVFSIVGDGRVARHDGPAFHWFALDPSGEFRSARFPRIPNGELRAVGARPTIVLSSDVPIAIAGDTLYFPERTADDRVRIVRATPSGSRSIHAALPPLQQRGDRIFWINGLAAGPAGSLYYTEDRAVRTIDAEGRVGTLAAVSSVPRCATIPGIGRELGAYLRGLAVDSEGNAWVAASGCGAVLRITPRGAVTVALTASPPWSPTAVAVSDRDVFVLEYLHTDSDERREWIPRVRRISADGTVSTIVNTAPR